MIIAIAKPRNAHPGRAIDEMRVFFVEQVVGDEETRTPSPACQAGSQWARKSPSPPVSLFYPHLNILW